ncbi:glycoside hydrolase N-terminal domain-containing protein [Planomonospora sp. ID91781]|uniref:glycosyl hydrolase family 95 catalytic domain-containing protein n=1 Tax=Planomonospora sp. ID91781 TaxID=2738135 RepID=UPI0018C3619E|nr:glycoside hydrolase N-terminal domain-containing protein [Planomonospora sp. ID91781]MBG0820838.1 glycoside hydrolase N-terminal domain-containing protein [Planomonospora sp. ID91781]
MDHGVVSSAATGDWERALITGNGRQGALVYGEPGEFRVTLSHERLFLPVTEPLPPPHTARVLSELHALLYGGRPREAAERVAGLAAEEHPGYAETRWIDPLVPAATLAFSTRAPGGVRRTCDFTTGLVTQEHGPARQEVFASRPADVVAVRLSGAGGLLRLLPPDGEPPVPVRFTSETAPGRLVLRADLPECRPGAMTGYTVECRVDGEAEALPDGLAVRGEALVLVRTVVHGVGRAGGEPYPLDGLPADFGRLLDEHAAVHGGLLARSEVRLPDGGPVERLFTAGRYAVISSSGELPPTLQGVWTGTYDPPWRSGFTMDGNLASAVAALPCTGTPELMLPVFDLADAMMDDFRQNARRLYGCRGILVPAHLSTHGLHNHFGPVWCLTFWTAGAGWLARLYHDHYAHTGDLAFLRERALPFMTEAALFYEDFLDGGGDFVPSYSPENTPAGGDSQACVNATMDVAVVRDLLRNLVRACELLGLDPARWWRLLERLPVYRIAPTGELAEWIGPRHLADGAPAGTAGGGAGGRADGGSPGGTGGGGGGGLPADNHAHRHASHLYPLWYERDPAFDDPRLAAAAELAVRRRLEWWRGEGSDEMAFGLVQLGLAAASLGLAEEAHETLTLLATRYWREENLVSTHNRDAIFNVDVCGGLPALVAAMLVRSSLPGAGYGRVDLLPALPEAWPRGEARGLVVRGGTVERLTWKPGRVEAVVRAWAPLLVTCGIQSARVLPGEALPLTFVGLDAKLIQQLEA